MRVLLLGLLVGTALAQNPPQFAGYKYSKGACRGGLQPGANAGLKFFRDRNCKSRCDNDPKCTGFVLPAYSNQSWCETYTSSKAYGDGRNFYCYMKDAHQGAPPKMEQFDGYEYTKGACRGGQSPGANAGLKLFRDGLCKKRCDDSPACTGFVLPMSGNNWCETYTSKGAKGDGRNFRCYMKKAGGQPGEQKYVQSKGACRGGKMPQNNAGLKFYRDGNCKARCDQDMKCTGYVLPAVGQSWCETYTSSGAYGDGRNFRCFMKEQHAGKPTPAPKFDGYVYSKGACRGGQMPGANAGLRFYRDSLCKKRCDEDVKCTGFVYPAIGMAWCETYTSPGAKGDGRNFRCYMKETGPTPQPTMYTGGYVQTKGACRGGRAPQNNAGLRFYRDNLCKSRCNKSVICTGYVLPAVGEAWCETYTSPGATGDGRNFRCFMKGKVVPTVKPTMLGDWVRTVGACRGGMSPGANAGLKFYRDKNCMKRCHEDANCTGFVVPVSGAMWCETYTSEGARGDGRTQYVCYMKKDKASMRPTVAPTFYEANGYERSVGACRGGKTPGANAGLKFYAQGGCEKMCNEDDKCTGFVIPVRGGNWCETYTSEGALGDKRAQFACYMKKADEDACMEITKRKDCSKAKECLWMDKASECVTPPPAFEDYDAFIDYCEEEDMCKECFGKEKKGKCKYPKAKKIKCKKIKDLNFCLQLGCKLKKGKKCDGKAFSA